MNKGVILGLLLTLTGCSTIDALNAVNPLKEDKGISATVQLGKENHSDTSKQLLKAKVGDAESNSVTGNQNIEKGEEQNKVNGNQTINKTTNVPWWTAVLLLFVRPMVILKDTIDLFRRKRGE